MKVGVFGNENKIRNENVLSEFVFRLRASGFDVRLIRSDEEISDEDVLVVLGGDGTLLHAATEAARKGTPIVGVNYGRLGFLTEFEKGEEDEAIALLHTFANGTCSVCERTLLEIEFDEKTYYALNELSLQRDYSDPDSQIMQTRAKVGNGKEISFLGDGAIVSAPTGSTAYSLSAGGAILDPDAPVFMLTPICSFSLNARSVVFPDTKTVCLEVSRSKAAVLVDGKSVGNIGEDQIITIKKAPFTAKFLLRGQSCFYDKINKKLK